MPLKIVFCGTSAFALPALRACSEDTGLSVVLVITQPDRPAGRKQLPLPPPVKLAAEEAGIAVIQPERIGDEESRIARLKPDVIATVAYGQWIPPSILRIPSRAAVNVHPSLLPRWRGASPIPNALLAGDRETGVTVQRMVEELDAGPILGQKRYPIGERATAEILSADLAVLGAKLLVATLRSPLQEHPQDASQVTVCRKLTRLDGLADPAEMTAEEIDRRVRALSPWPGVTIAAQKLKILETSLLPSANAYPLPCRGGTVLYLLRVQTAGKKPMSGVEWRRGMRG